MLYELFDIVDSHGMLAKHYLKIKG